MMQNDMQKFRAVRFRFETDIGTYWERYLIVENHIPLFRVNQWLELKGIRKASTGREYAKKMAVFLNWLDGHDASYKDATNRHVRLFLHFLVFGNLQNDKIKSIQSTVSGSTLEKYITVITGFYRWLDDVCQTEMLWGSKSIRANRSFFYGQIYSYEYKYLVDGYTAMLSPAENIPNGMMKQPRNYFVAIFPLCATRRF